LIAAKPPDAPVATAASVSVGNFARLKHFSLLIWPRENLGNFRAAKNFQKVKNATKLQKNRRKQLLSG